MKSPLFKVLIIGIVAVGASLPAFSQTGNPWLEQWYRAKFGRALPAEAAQLSSTQRADPPTSAAATTTTVAPANTWFENWYRDKYGRPSPLVDPIAPAQHQAKKSSKVTDRQSQTTVNTWFEQWYRDKYGRPSPQEETRLQSDTK
jgi:hypothetical protein